MPCWTCSMKKWTMSHNLKTKSEAELKWRRLSAVCLCCFVLFFFKSTLTCMPSTFFAWAKIWQQIKINKNTHEQVHVHFGQYGPVAALYSALVCVPRHDSRPGLGGSRTAASCQRQAWRPSPIPLHHSAGSIQWFGCRLVWNPNLFEVQVILIKWFEI